MEFDSFRKDWLKRHPGSYVPKPRISSWGLVGGICLWAVIAIGAALVSGAHSIPAILITIPAIVTTPYREILSLFGFTIFELLIFAGALYRRVSAFAKFGLYVALTGALFANIGSSVYSVMQAHGSVLDLVVAVVLAVIAPLAAFLAGEMVHQLFAQHQTYMESRLAEWAEKQRKLDATINREYEKWAKGQTQENESSRNFMKSDEPKKRRVNIHEIAKKVHENGDENLLTEEMMTKYDISQGSTSKVREIAKSLNGHQH